MRHFNPVRASSPAKSLSSSTATLSESRSAIAPELLHLSSEDVDILDAIIARAGHSATTFFTVFKAYSDVLGERGLHPQEVVYYGKLLKLGTLKGKNWGEKWKTVKAHLDSQYSVAPTCQTFKSVTDDLESLRSDTPIPAERVDHISEDNNSQLSSPSLHPAMKRLFVAPTCQTFKSVTDDFESLRSDTPVPAERVDHIFEDDNSQLSPLLLGTPMKRLLAHANRNPLVNKPETKAKALKDFDFSIPSPIKADKPVPLSLTADTDSRGRISPVPPSYKSTPFASVLPIAQRIEKSEINQPNSTLKAALPIKQAASQPKERKNLDDAWKNIKMEQDEKCADNFRNDMLLTRCWEIWRQGFQWIMTTHQQIGEARDRMLLRLFMQRWQSKLASRRQFQNQQVVEFSKRHLKTAFRVWQAKLKQKQQLAWRSEMRKKMKIIKNKLDLNVKKDAWAKWRQIQLAHRADRQYRLFFLVRFFARWKTRLRQVSEMADVANEYASHLDLKAADRCWDYWKRSAVSRNRELVVIRRVDWRIMVNAFDQWKQRGEEGKFADKFYDRKIQKHAIARWKVALQRLRSKETRAVKYVARQDHILICAVLRVWRAHMRGRRLEQFKTSQIVKNAWSIWKSQHQHRQAQLNEALNFVVQSDSQLASRMAQRWYQVLGSHQNATIFAVNYNEAQLRAKTLLAWRLRLRSTLQSHRVAQLADRFFATRRAWRLWLKKVEERKRLERFKAWNIARVRRAFDAWLLRTRKKQYLGRCESIIKDLVDKRTMSATLTHWTKRVIELKSQELDVVQYYALSVQRIAFQKWKACQRRHVEETSLLENHLLLKREDILRRAFHRWLAAKRAREHRRQTYQRKEDLLRRTIIITAWERWRERFMEEKLQPLEYQVILQNQRNMVSRIFELWLSKTTSLPAVQFNSRRIKEKFFKRWRNAIPKALRERKARETDRYNTLAKHFEIWIKTYQAKIMRKAVARAKNLRLPTASSRQYVTSSSAFPSSHHLLPRRSARAIESDADDAPGKPLTSISGHPRTSLITRPPITARRGWPDKSPSRSEYTPSVTRQASPVRSAASLMSRRARSPAKGPSSIASGGNEGGKLWTALKEVNLSRQAKGS